MSKGLAEEIFSIYTKRIAKMMSEISNFCVGHAKATGDTVSSWNLIVNCVQCGGDGNAIYTVEVSPVCYKTKDGDKIGNTTTATTTVTGPFVADFDQIADVIRWYGFIVGIVELASVVSFRSPLKLANEPLLMLHAYVKSGDEVKNAVMDILKTKYAQG